jgi:hypothetical protein
VPFLLFTHPRLLFALDAMALVVLSAVYYVVILRHGALGAAIVTSSYALLKTGVFQITAFRTLRRRRGLD